MSELLLHRLLEVAARERTDQIAVIDRDRCCTYDELDTRANGLAHVLRERGVRPGDRVGLYLEKRLEAIVALYGVLKSGAAYVPLDPQAPVPRLSYILAKCGVEVLVTGMEKRRTLPDQTVTNTLVAFVSLDRHATAEEVAALCAGELPAYMLPDRVEPLPRLPAMSTGKVDRQQLAELAEVLTRGDRPR